VVFTAGRAGRGLAGTSGFVFCCKLPVEGVLVSAGVGVVGWACSISDARFSNFTPCLRADGRCFGGEDAGWVRIEGGVVEGVGGEPEMGEGEGEGAGEGCW
jgi:hypothetical protein